jgi:hypothetical protein
MESLLAPVDELVAWSQARPRTAKTRREVLRRIAVLLQGPWSRWSRFVQENQPAMRYHRVESEQTQRRMFELFAAVVDPHAEPRQQVRSVLALATVFFGNRAAEWGALSALGIELTAAQFEAAAMDVALELVGDLN